MPPRRQTRRGAAALPIPLLRLLGSKVQQNGDSTHCSLSELERAAQEALSWTQNKDNSGRALPPFWIAVAPAQPYLQAAYALTLRRSCAAISPSVGESFRVAYASLRRLLTSQLRDCTTRPWAFPVRGLRLILIPILRAHALRCLAGLLSDAVTQLGRRSFQRTQRSMAAMAQTLEEACQLLDACRNVLMMQDEGKIFDIGASSRAALAEVLREELIASSVLEHWSRLLLLMTTCEQGMNYARRQLFLMSPVLMHLCQQLRDDHLDKPWRHRLLERQPSFAYLLSSHVVGLCAALDGGPRYGLVREPPLTQGDNQRTTTSSGPSVAPLFNQVGHPVLADAQHGVSTPLVRCALQLWVSAVVEQRRRRRGSGAAPAGGSNAGPSSSGAAEGQQRQQRQHRSPASAAAAQLGNTDVLTHNTNALFTICLRLAAVGTAGVVTSLKNGASSPAVASARCAAVAAVRQRSRDLGLTAPPSAPVELAAWAFRCADAIVDDAMTDWHGDGEPPAVLVSRLRRRWVAFVAYINAAAAAAAEGATKPLAGIGHAFVLKKEHSRGLPRAPTPSVAAALGAGYVPALTHALRALGDSGESPWRLCLMPLEADGHPLAWTELLAFGSPAETAALLSSVIQLLSRAASQAQTCYDPAHPEQHNRAVDRVDRPALEELCTALDALNELYAFTVDDWAATVEREHESLEAAGAALASAASAADVPAGLPRLALMMSYLAVNLLPVISHALVRCAIPSGELGGEHGGMLEDDYEFEDRLCRGVAGLLSWVALLVQVQVPPLAPPPEGATVEAVRMAVGGAMWLARSPAAESWRALLLRQLHVPELLAVAIRVAPDMMYDTGEVSVSLSHVMRMLLVFAPAELAAALTSPRAVLAARCAGSLVQESDEEPQPSQQPASGTGLHPFLATRLGLVFGEEGCLPEPALLATLHAVCSSATTPVALGNATAGKTVELDPEEQYHWRGAALLVPPSRLHQLLPHL